MASTAFRRLTLALVAGTGIWLPACSDRLPTGYDRDSIMPLHEGNRWIGKVEEYDSLGGVTVERFDTIELRSDEARVFPDRAGVRYWHNDDTLFWNDPEEPLNYLLGNGGFNQTNIYPGPRALYPAVVGDTFGILDITPVLLNNPNQQTTPRRYIGSVVNSTDTLITTPAGTYSCYLYAPVAIQPSDASLDLQRYSLFAPGVGPVRIDIYRGSPSEGTLIHRWELTEVLLF